MASTSKFSGFCVRPSQDQWVAAQTRGGKIKEQIIIGDLGKAVVSISVAP